MLKRRWFLVLLAGLGIVLAAVMADGGLGAYTDQETVADDTFSSIDCIVGGNTGFLDASSDAADTGGNGDGFEANPTNAYANGGGYAENVHGPGDRHRYYDYGISTESGCNIAGIEVQIDWWLDSTVDTHSMDVELSWDGGSSWTAAKTDTVETTTEHSTVLGTSADDWGHTWTATELNNANFRVRLTAQCSGGSCGSRHTFLDWVTLKVYYGPVPPTDTPTFTPTNTPTNTPTPGPSVSQANAWTTGLTHTIGTGSNRLLVFTVGMENGMEASSPPAGDRDVTAVSYGGQSLTLAAEVVVCSGSPNSFCDRTELWYLDEAGIQAATGSTFSVTWSGDPPFELEEYFAAVTLEGVDQSSPIGDTSTNSTTTANPIQTSGTLTVGQGDFVVVSAIAGTLGSYTPGSGYTEGADQSALSSTMASAYKAIVTAGTEQPSMLFDFTIQRQVILAVAINAP